MTRKRKLLLQASAVMALGAFNLMQPRAAHAAYYLAATESDCGGCVSGGGNAIDFCFGDLIDQNAFCVSQCGSLGTNGDCGTGAGNSGCDAGDIGFDCV